MDTRSRKWTNKVLITLVMIAMTLSGIYGLDTINNMAVTGDNSFSLDEQDQSDYIKNTQMSLFDKWADQEGDKVYYTQANHVSESLLNKIKKESFVKVTMKVIADVPQRLPLLAQFHVSLFLCKAFSCPP